MKKLTSIILSLLLILVLVTASGAKSIVVAQESDELILGSEGYYCFDEAWVFAISEINNVEDAPSVITVTWGDTTEEVTLYGVEEGFAVYITYNNLDKHFTQMSFDEPKGWEGDAGVVYGPCFEEENPTVTTEVTESITPSVTTSVTPSITEEQSLTPSPTEVPQGGTNSNTSNGPTATPTQAPQATATPTPTVTSVPAIGGAVLGAKTMAKSGTFDQAARILGTNAPL